MHFLPKSILDLDVQNKKEHFKKNEMPTSKKWHEFPAPIDWEVL